MVLPFADTFCCLLEYFSCFFSEISVKCQAVRIQIMPFGPEVGPNCLVRLSADDTSK